MTLPYQPKEGEVVKCDFNKMAPIRPEMVKHRDVIVIAQHKHNPRLVTVIPLSTTEPRPERAYHYRMPKNPRPGSDVTVWAKCDMIYTVSIERLDGFYKKTRRQSRQPIEVYLSTDDFAAIKKRVAIALDLTDNRQRTP